MTFYPLEKQENMHDGYRNTFLVNGVPLLLLRVKERVFLLENRCGHFGMPLDGGEVKEGVIVCTGHGISFSLENGAIVNRPYENADPVKVYDVVFRDGFLGVVL